MPHDSDPNERFDVEEKPDEAPMAMLEGAAIEETPPDIISDTGLEGGVDAVNEDSEDTDVSPEP